jgi:2-dehydro-3-deoxygluconokinase
MSEQKPRVVAIGEVMIELARGGDGRFAVACGGDTFNTAVYLARAGIDVAFASALGDDPFSDGILALAAAEGVASDLILRVPGRLPGLDLIDTDAAGRRHVHCWHSEAPARELFELPDWGRVAETCSRPSLFLSASRFRSIPTMALGRFLAVVELRAQNGPRSLRRFPPRGWKGDLTRTRTVFMEALKRVDIALPTYDDEAVLWGDPSPEATVDRLGAFGIGEIVVKNGPNSALVFSGGQSEFIPVPEVVVPVDTMAAGDSFNAAYIAARLLGDGPSAAAAAAHRLAGQVIRHRGSIMPRTATAMH